jgi:outer membrane immunogenic protein
MSKSRNVAGGGIALVLALSASGPWARAEAADYLRGAYAGETAPQAAAGPDWAGFYGGAYFSAVSGQFDHTAFASPLAHAALPNSNIEDLLRKTISLKTTNKMAFGIGGFVGINYLWDDVVMGFEADYTRSSLSGTATSGPYGLFRDEGTERWGVSSTTTTRGRVADWGTLRGRIGYASGLFMPYVTAGVALGNIDGRATTSGSWTNTSLLTPPAHATQSGSFEGTVGRRGVSYGAAMGAGIDMQLVPGTFLRTEYQHIQFAGGGKRPDISINTARVGGGMKF